MLTEGYQVPVSRHCLYSVHPPPLYFRWCIYAALNAYPAPLVFIDLHIMRLS